MTEDTKEIKQSFEEIEPTLKFEVWHKHAPVQWVRRKKLCERCRIVLRPGMQFNCFHKSCRFFLTPKIDVDTVRTSNGADRPENKR